MSVFGLTCVDMEAAEAGDEEDNPPLHFSGEQLPRSNSPGIPETDLAIHPPANFTLPVINTPSGSQAFLTEAPSVASSPGAGGLSKPIPSPMGTPSAKQRSSKTLAALHAGSVPSSAAGGTRPGAGSVPSSPQPTRRLPPISNKQQQQQQQDTESPPDRASPNLPPSSAASSKQLLTAAAPDPNRDMRNFDGKDLHDLIKIGHEDYNDVARLQSVITMQLSSKTTEAAKAEALLQIRQASISNPFFSMTPALYELVKEHLNSRNRILRPCAAYALAGYAANSRHGRGLMAVNAAELLPRLNAMLRCKVDSLDARYASLALLTASMHTEHKEAVGRSGAIPLLINLIRQNLGRHNMHTSDAAADTVVGGVLGLASGASSSAGSAAPSTPRGGSSTTGEPEGDFPNGGSHPRISAVQLAHDGRTAHEHDAQGLHTSGGGGGASANATSSGSISTATALQQLALSLNPNPAAAQVAEEGRGMYTLAGKPAAAHAAATLVNLAEVPANRQRMRDAGIAALLEDVMLCRNENIIKERCRLLVDFLQMDAPKFLEAKAAADKALLVATTHAYLSFHHHLNSHRHPPSTAHRSGATSLRTLPPPGDVSPRAVLGGTAARGTLTWAIAKQLEREASDSDEPLGSHLVATTLTLTGGIAAAVATRQAFSRVQSQSAASARVMARAQTHKRRNTGSVSTTGGQSLAGGQRTEGVEDGEAAPGGETGSGAGGVEGVGGFAGGAGVPVGSVA